MAPSSIAETVASAPPRCPSPRLPPIHSAIGVRAPETTTISASEGLATGWLLGLTQNLKRDGAPVSGGAAPRDRLMMLPRPARFATLFQRIKAPSTSQGSRSP